MASLTLPRRWWEQPLDTCHAVQERSIWEHMQLFVVVVESWTSKQFSCLPNCGRSTSAAYSYTMVCSITIPANLHFFADYNSPSHHVPVCGRRFETFLTQDPQGQNGPWAHWTLCWPCPLHCCGRKGGTFGRMLLFISHFLWRFSKWLKILPRWKPGVFDMKQLAAQSTTTRHNSC